MAESPKARRSSSRLTILFGVTFLEAAAGILAILLFPNGHVYPYRLIIAAPAAVLLLLSAWGTGSTFFSEEKTGVRLQEWFGSPSLLPRCLLAALLSAVGAVLLAVVFLPEPFLKGIQSALSAVVILGGLCALIVVEWLAAWWFAQGKNLPGFPLRHLGALLALTVFLASVLLRLPLAGYALPYHNVWDEVVTYPAALQMFTEPGLKPVSYVPAYGASAYGDLLTYIAFAGDTIGYLNGMRAGEVHSVSDLVSPPPGASIYEAVHPSGIPLQFPRLLIILINSLAPVFIFLILRKVFRVNTWLSFGAALIYAGFSREVVYYSSFILPDGLAATFTALLFLAALKAMQGDGKKWLPWCACGILAGVVVSFNIRNLLVLLVPILALLLSWKKGESFWMIPIALFGALAGFALTSPYSLLDFPAYIQRVSALYWGFDSTLTHRLASLVFYVRGAIAPGFESAYVESAGGSVGFGILVGLLALIGVYRGIARFPRQTLLLAVFSAAQLFLVLPIVQNYTRHILILYPLICVLAGIGLAQLAALLRRRLDRVRTSGRPAPGHFAPGIILAAFLLLHLGQLGLTADYIRRESAFRPSQDRAADYLAAILQPGDVVGIQENVPFVEEDLVRRGIAFQRISAAETISDLRALGITYVIGTDRLGGDYLAAAPSLWENYFQLPGAILAVFGKDRLAALGYPCADLYLFVGRVPGN
jgi:hypothetical protein